MSKSKLYVLHVEGCIEPSVKGPFKNCKARDAKAKKLRNADEDDGVFWLDVKDGKPIVGSYSGGFMEGISGFYGTGNNMNR